MPARLASTSWASDFPIPRRCAVAVTPHSGSSVVNKSSTAPALASVPSIAFSRSGPTHHAKHHSASTFAARPRRRRQAPPTVLIRVSARPLTGAGRHQGGELGGPQDRVEVAQILASEPIGHPRSEPCCAKRVARSGRIDHIGDRRLHEPLVPCGQDRRAAAAVREQHDGRTPREQSASGLVRRPVRIEVGEVVLARLDHVGQTHQVA